MPFVAFRTGPEVYEATSSPVAVAEASITQIVRTVVEDADSGAVAEETWKGFCEALDSESTDGVQVTHGHSLNLEKKTYLGALGWSDEKVRCTSIACL